MEDWVRKVQELYFDGMTPEEFYRKEEEERERNRPNKKIYYIPEEHDDEIYRDVVENSNYEVSNYGNVRSLRYRGQNGLVKKLKPGHDGRGYPYVVLTSDDGSQDNFKIHRLVATMFIPNPDNLPIVNHKDEDKRNNNVDNLEWCTEEYNLEYGTARARQSQSKRDGGKLAGANNPRARKVICLETMEIFMKTV